MSCFIFTKVFRRVEATLPYYLILGQLTYLKISEKVSHEKTLLENENLRKENIEGLIFKRFSTIFYEWFFRTICLFSPKFSTFFYSDLPAYQFGHRKFYSVVWCIPYSEFGPRQGTGQNKKKVEPKFDKKGNPLN